MACDCDETLSIQIEECVQKCTHTISTDCVILPSGTCDYPPRTTLTEWLEDACASGFGGGCEVNEVTYDELVALMEASGLTECELYLLTDYQTIYDQPDYDISGNTKVSVETKTSDVEPLLIRAISTNEISEVVFSPMFPADIIYYTPTFANTEIMDVTRKGWIYRRVQPQLEIDVAYDWRTVLYKRYESSPGSGVFNSYKDNGNDFIETLSFDPDAGDNSIVKLKISVNLPIPGISDFWLSNNVLYKSVINTEIGAACVNNTFIDDVYTFKIGILGGGNVFNGIITDVVMSDYTIDNEFQDISACRFKLDVNSNVFGVGFEHNTFNAVCINNIFGDDNKFNQFLAECTGNTLPNEFISNTAHYSFTHNSFSGPTSNNIFLNICYGNTITNDFYNNTVKEFINNELDVPFFDNTLGWFENNVHGYFPISDFEYDMTGYFAYNDIKVMTNSTTLSNVFVYNQCLNIDELQCLYAGEFSENQIETILNSTFGSAAGHSVRRNKINSVTGSLIDYTFTDNIGEEIDDCLIGAEFHKNYFIGYSLTSKSFSTDTNHHIMQSTSGRAYAEFDFGTANLLTGNPELKGFIPLGAIPSELCLVVDSLAGGAGAELAVGIETEDENYGISSTDITTIINSKTITLSTETIADRAIKISASVDNITGGTLKVWVNYIKL